jgi:plasmid maintenance system killer protein
MSRNFVTFSRSWSGAEHLRIWTCRASGVHALKGVLKGHYAVSVSGNWRVTFRFEDGHAVDVDYADYH